MSQVKDFPEKDTANPPSPDDFLYLITQGNTDWNIQINSILGRKLTKTIIDPLYTLLAADIYHTIRFTFPASKAITVPEHADTPFTAFTTIRLRNASPLSATIVKQTAGITINSKAGLTIPPHGEVLLTNISPDVWDATGDLV